MQRYVLDAVVKEYTTQFCHCIKMEVGTKKAQMNMYDGDGKGHEKFGTKYLHGLRQDEVQGRIRNPDLNSFGDNE